MARLYLTRSRHGTTPYFRRRVPDHLRPILGKQYLILSLGQCSQHEAAIRARSLAAQTDRIFADLQTMARTGKGIRLDYALSWEHDDLGKRRAVARDVAPGEEISAAQAVATLQEHLDGEMAAPTSNRARAASASEQADIDDHKPSERTISTAWASYKAEKITTKAWKDAEDTVLAIT